MDGEHAGRGQQPTGSIHLRHHLDANELDANGQIRHHRDEAHLVLYDLLLRGVAEHAQSKKDSDDEKSLQGACEYRSPFDSSVPALLLLLRVKGKDGSTHSVALAVEFRVASYSKTYISADIIRPPSLRCPSHIPLTCLVSRVGYQRAASHPGNLSTKAANPILPGQAA